MKKIVKYIKKGINYIKKYGFIEGLRKIRRKIVIFKTYSKFNDNYKDWIYNNEPKESEIKKQEKFKFKYEPKISILIPMYNTNEIFFKELIESLKAQTYKNFEVCLADGSQVENKELEKYFSDDNRFKYKHLSENKGISENTNAALDMATGEFIALVDHDDTLPCFALYEVVKIINDNPDVEFIYSDEDILDAKHERKNPYFKPDFSPDTLRSSNYICHLSVLKKTLIDEIGKFRAEFDGAQDYDMILRATEKAKLIVHIPKILYHWRAHENSTSQNTDSKSYAFIAGKKAIEEQLKRLNIKGNVELLETPGTYKVNYEVINNPLVSIIIPNKDSIQDLNKCISSVLKSTYNNYEIIIVENNSENKETFDFYNKLEENNKNVHVVKYEEKGFNFSKINNFGRKFAKGEYILLLNNDVEVINENWIEEMLGICQQKNVGIVGAKLLYPDNSVQHAGVIIGIGGVAGHIHKNIKDSDPGYFSRAVIVNNFSAVTAACLLVKTNIFDEVGGLDETLEVAFNDVDFCMKVRNKGYLVVYTPFAKLHHFESKSRGNEDTKEKKNRFSNEIDRFKEKWQEELEKGDPYFNKNFRLDDYLFVIDINKK